MKESASKCIKLNVACVANCQHLQIVNIFSTTLSTTNHPLLYNHYIYASLSHVDRRKKRE
jgi:hypothetical protein